MFIVFEGIDGSGTSTQSELLANCIQKKFQKEVYLTHEPTQYGKVGTLLHDTITKKISAEERIHPVGLQFLFLADRTDHVVKKIQPALNKGKIVICDRYFWSTVAYASLCGADEILKKNKPLFLEPDITIFLDISAKRGLQRVKKRGTTDDLFEKEEMLEKVAKSYRNHLNVDKKILDERGSILREEFLCIDSGRFGIKEIEQIIWKKIIKMFEEKSKRT